LGAFQEFHPSLDHLLVRPVFITEAARIGIAPRRLNLAFNGAAWNAHEYLQRQTNCYAYALNCPEAGWAIPGQLASTKRNAPENIHVSVRTIRNRLMKDGLISITEEQALSGKFHAIALVIAPNRDCHFYRRDPDGTWSHKDSIDLAARNPTITVPSRDALDQKYLKFGGYYAVPPNGVQYRQRLRIPEPLLQLFG
jgi:hypothetical protein